ncbi:hypothetical protein LZ32DRAFT_621163 [Colletotrichum eremochloae]|nr:hypothetical protein LZ32DRAFT_621163 [Colletotrichum eremochloae]
MLISDLAEGMYWTRTCAAFAQEYLVISGMKRRGTGLELEKQATITGVAKGLSSYGEGVRTGSDDLMALARQDTSSRMRSDVTQTVPTNLGSLTWQRRSPFATSDEHCPLQTHSKWSGANHFRVLEASCHALSSVTNNGEGRKQKAQLNTKVYTQYEVRIAHYLSFLDVLAVCASSPDRLCFKGGDGRHGWWHG